MSDWIIRYKRKEGWKEIPEIFRCKAADKEHARHIFYQSEKAKDHVGGSIMIENNDRYGY